MKIIKNYNQKCFLMQFFAFGGKLEKVRNFPFIKEKIYNVKANLHKDIGIITFCDEKSLKKIKPLFIEQCKNNNIPIEVLSTKKWKNNLDKIFLLKDFINKGYFTKKYYLIVDSFDVVLINDIGKI